MTQILNELNDIGSKRCKCITCNDSGLFHHASKICLKGSLKGPFT